MGPCSLQWETENGLWAGSCFWPRGFGGRPARARRGFESFERAGGEDLGETSEPASGICLLFWFGNVVVLIWCVTAGWLEPNRANHIQVLQVALNVKRDNTLTTPNSLESSSWRRTSFRIRGCSRDLCLVKIYDQWPIKLQLRLVIYWVWQNLFRISRPSLSDKFYDWYPLNPDNYN